MLEIVTLQVDQIIFVGQQKVDNRVCPLFMREIIFIKYLKIA
jgi:hypothetical protein